MAAGVAGLLASAAAVEGQMVCSLTGGEGYCRYGNTPSWWCYDGTLYGDQGGGF